MNDDDLRRQYLSKLQLDSLDRRKKAFESSQDYLDKANKIIGTDETPSRPVIEELSQFRRSWFYHNWKFRFKRLGQTGLIAIPNTTFEEWVWWFHEWAQAFEDEYNEFKDLVWEAIEIINKHLTIIDGEIDDLQDRVDKLEECCKKVQDEINNINNEIGDIWNVINQILDSIASTGEIEVPRNVNVDGNHYLINDVDLGDIKDNTRIGITWHMGSTRRTDYYTVGDLKGTDSHIFAFNYYDNSNGRDEAEIFTRIHNGNKLWITTIHGSNIKDNGEFVWTGIPWTPADAEFSARHIYYSEQNPDYTNQTNGQQFGVYVDTVTVYDLVPVLDSKSKVAKYKEKIPLMFKTKKESEK